VEERERERGRRKRQRERVGEERGEGRAATEKEDAEEGEGRDKKWHEGRGGEKEAINEFLTCLSTFNFFFASAPVLLFLFLVGALVPGVATTVGSSTSRAGDSTETREIVCFVGVVVDVGVVGVFGFSGVFGVLGVSGIGVGGVGSVD
jgi:hypothetical protein